MRISTSLMLVATVCAAAAWGDDKAPTASDDQFKELSGMSVLGNNEAPKSLVIVPWKSSQIGDGIGVVESLSNRPMPVDRDVFARELHYYELRADTPSDSGRSDSVDLRVGAR
jgi:hypothetical protein